MRTLLACVGAMLLAALPLAAAAAPAVGWDFFPRSCQWISPEAQIDSGVSPALPVAKFQIGDAFSTDPIDVQRAIQRGATFIILRTDDGLKGYSYQVVQRLIESPGGIAGYSYADLMLRNPRVQFVLEVSNEPDVAGIPPWVARWWALALYKELALNALGHIDQPWREKYPMLKWAVSLPATYANTQIMLQWRGGHEIDPLGAGGVRDYYDYLANHLYGHFDVMDGGGGDWTRIHAWLLNDPYTNAVIVSEVGINDPSTPDALKAQRYRDWANAQPPKVKAAAVFSFCIDSYPSYTIGDTPDVVRILGGS